MSPDELSSEVRRSFAYAARYIAPFLRAESVNEALKRPDVQAELEDAVDLAREAVTDAVRAAWAVHGSPPNEYLAWQAADVDRLFRLRGRLRAALRRDGVAGLLRVADEVALRSVLTLHVTETAARTFRQLAEGEKREMAGETVYKQWVSRKDADVCHWCRALNGMVVPLHAGFPEGDPADLTGHGRLTQPPRWYRRLRLGPPRHPRCRCRLRIITDLSGHQVASLSGGQDPDAAPPQTGFLAAEDVRAVDGDRYTALTALVSAAVSELRAWLRKAAER